MLAVVKGRRAWAAGAAPGQETGATGRDGREVAGFPNLTGEWIVTSPVAAGTREGDLFVCSTPTPSCRSSWRWAREHPDRPNGDDFDFTAAVKLSCAG